MLPTEHPLSLHTFTCLLSPLFVDLDDVKALLWSFLLLMSVLEYLVKLVRWMIKTFNHHGEKKE